MKTIRTHRPPHPATRLATLAIPVLAAAALTAGPLTTASAANTNTNTHTATSTAANTAATQTPAPTTAAAAAPGDRTAYLAVAAKGSRRYIQLVNQANGRVLKTLTSAPVVSGVEPYWSADLAGNGTTWLIRNATVTSQYGTVLQRIDTAGRLRTMLWYATSVRVSPDSTKLAVSIFSPDADHDGYGLAAVRIVNAANGKVLKTLATRKFPVDSAGNPIGETGGLQVDGWLGSYRLVVSQGCCDEASVSIISAVTPSAMSTWKAHGGDHNVTAVGTFGTVAALITDNRPIGSTPGAFTNSGIIGLRITPANHVGTKVSEVKGVDVEATVASDRIIRRAGASPLKISTHWFRYAGTLVVRRAYL